MPSTTTVRPTSLADLRETLYDWLSHDGPPASPIRVFQERLVIRLEALKKVRFSLTEGCVALKRGRRRLNVALDDLEAGTEGQGNQLHVVFTLRSPLSSRPLRASVQAAVEKTSHPIFLARAVDALRDLEQLLPKERIEQAASAPNNYLVLLTALSASQVATQLHQADPLAAARLRAIPRQVALLKDFGGALSAEQAAQWLGISRQAVDKRRRRGLLIGLTQGRRGYAYPVWQFEAGRTLPHLEKVLEALSGHDPWMQMTFFLNGNDRLDGQRPLDALRQGQLEPVLQAASALGEHGAA